MNEIKYSWKRFEKATEMLAKEIKKEKTAFDGVYGLPRGGLILAVCLSHRLNLKLLNEPTNNSLVADDISDTGSQLEKLKYKKVATIFSTPWTKVKPDYFIDFKRDQSDWILFPWEAK